MFRLSIRPQHLSKEYSNCASPVICKLVLLVLFKLSQDFRSCHPALSSSSSLSSVAATLTSYSENMERGGKYGEGSRGNLKLWQSQKSGMDSYLYRVDENMTASTYSLNKIPERNLESMSSHSAHSIPLYLMPRPNSVAGESLPLSPHNPVKVEKESSTCSRCAVECYTSNVLSKLDLWTFFYCNVLQ